jgi:hypothetical protein
MYCLMGRKYIFTQEWPNMNGALEHNLFIHKSRIHYMCINNKESIAGGEWIIRDNLLLAEQSNLISLKIHSDGKYDL